MIPCFGDTSYFLALLIPDDENHAVAREWASASGRPIVTTEYVLWEIANFLSPHQTRQLFGAFLNLVRTAPGMKVIPAFPGLFEAGLRLYVSRTDKDWSPTDCISFLVMGEHHISEALTADHHFTQAGFVAMLRGENLKPKRLNRRARCGGL